MRLIRERLPEAQLEQTQGEGIMVAVLDTWPWNDGDQLSSGPGVTRANDKILNFSASRLDAVPELKAAANITRVHNAVDANAAWAWGAKCQRFGEDGRAEPAYNMASHGLFVAGIIQDLAPKAEISVYRVLDDDGMGDLQTVARAMQAAVAEARGMGLKLVLNMSLDVAPPIWLMEAMLADPDCFFARPGALREAILSSAKLTVGLSPDEQLDRWQGLGLIDKDARQFRGMFSVVETMAAIAQEKDVLLVASAGNDSFGDTRRMGPRLPAALAGAVAVSAHLPKVARDKLASYSNDDDFFADYDGIGAFGGETAENRVDHYADAVPGDAVVGLYIGDPLPAPPGPANETGLAYWAGTSFAAPIVSGFAAAVWSASLGQDASVIRGQVIFDGGGTDRETLPFTQEFEP